jgi:hypothetical protein
MFAKDGAGASLAMEMVHVLCSFPGKKNSIEKVETVYT